MGCWLLLIEPVLFGSNSILKVHFLGHPVVYHVVIFLQHEVRLRPNYIFFVKPPLTKTQSRCRRLINRQIFWVNYKHLI